MERRSRGYYSGRKQTGSFGRTRRSSRFPKKLKTFDPSVLVKKAVVEQPAVFEPNHSFNDFDLCLQLKANIQAKGFVKPTPIQDQVITHLIQGKDVVGMANTGTGKTVAFLLPLINKVFRQKTEKVLIVAPTRELAVQIEDEFRSLAKNMQLYSAVCIGGVPIGRQISQLRRNPHFVIGTPGRLKDLEQRRVLNFMNFRSIVLDEVDRMLDMGFLPDVKHIISRLPRERQSLFFSATVPDKMRSIMQDFLHDPVTVSVKAGNTSANVDQDIVKVNGRVKIEILHELLIQEGFNKVIIFGRTKWGIEKLHKNLEQRGFKVAAIHGDKKQNQRQRSLDMFKRNFVNILLATDIASRGLDIENVTHVINYELPESYEDYVHRIGRTGRVDKKGTALTFID